MIERNDTGHTPDLDIAIVGMAGRFPAAPDVEALWANIRGGVEAVTHFSDETLKEMGVPEALLSDPDYVKAGVLFEEADRFDAEFFGYTPRDAENIDPQHRVFLECAWHALEHAGYDPHRYDGAIGVYAGAGANVYLMRHLLQGDALSPEAGIANLLGLMSGNMPDALATRVAYKLNLRGPAVTIQTACSTSLMAVHTACQALLGHECEMALAGGVSLNLLQNGGYRYQAGAIFSRDGHCRAFDADASGTLQGSGAALVVLKRLDDALRDGDTIHAVIKGSAANNDGSEKVGFTAPSVNGQAAVIRAAQDVAGVTADSIGYIEAHGTGTTLGDPIEVAALTQAFRGSTDRTGYCAIGSVKTNIGHLDAAAGVTGLIKAVLALKHKTLPPSLHFQTPNPQIDFDNSPFYVNTVASSWEASNTVRRAGVSSFGIGGTNVHVVLEEAPAPVPVGPPRESAAQRGVAKLQLLPVSALSDTALTSVVHNLAEAFTSESDASLEDIAFTLRAGRRHMSHRAVALARTLPQAGEAFTRRDPTMFVEGKVVSEQPSVAFLFPGQGAQHVGMSKALYDSEPSYRDTVDRCSELLRPHLALDLRDLLFPTPDQATAAAQQLAQTAVTQPALFVVEYAMAKWWMQQGIQPDAMLGHSIGEYAAACLAGVFTLEDALSVVAARGRLIQSMAPGAMLAISLPERDLRSHRYAGCDLAAVNAADLCVLSGPVECIERAEQDILSRGIGARRLHVSHGFHSAMVEPMLAQFEALLATVKLSAPTVPFISNVTGRWITAEQATSSAYWANHVRCTVRFADGLGELLGKKDRVLLEVGPGDTLTSLARRHASAAGRPVMASQCHPQRAASNGDQPMRCLAQLWVAGVDVPVMRAQEAGRRVALPGYPFERGVYWVERGSMSSPESQIKARAGGRDPSEWLYLPAWKRLRRGTSQLAAMTGAPGCTLVFGESNVLVDPFCDALRNLNSVVIRVERGERFARLERQRFSVMPCSDDDLGLLLDKVQAEFGSVARIYHLWNVDIGERRPLSEDMLDVGFHSVIAIARTISATSDAKLALHVVASGMEDVTGLDAIYPERATLEGPCKVIPLEYPNITCRLIDVSPVLDDEMANRLIRQILSDSPLEGDGNVIALRGIHQWVRNYQPVSRDIGPKVSLRTNGVYLITGGFGGVGLCLAKYLAQTYQARIILLGRNVATPEHQQTLRDLEALGGKTLAVTADVSDAAQLRAAIDVVTQRFGRLHGVIHAAGMAGGGMMATRTREAMERVLAPKLAGSINLLAAVSGQTPDFVLLCSSMTATTGGFGQVDYCAANCAQDAIAWNALHQQATKVFSVNWDVWRGLGMAVSQTLPLGIGIAPEEGGRLLEAVLAAGPGQTLVSTIDIARQFERVRGPTLADEVLPSLVPSRAQHARPSLSTPFVEPAGDLELSLSRLWSEFLGIAPIGVADNFFELGGDSLLAIQVLAKVRLTYAVDIAPAPFLKSPTVSELAVLVETALIEQIERADCTDVSRLSASR